MAISFARIPSTLRKPFIYFEVDASQAGGSPSTVRPALLCGQRTSAATVAAGVPTLIGSALDAANYFGRGSMLHRMAVAYRAQDSLGELWAIAVADPAGAADTLALTVTGPATGNGTLYLYIGGQLLTQVVTSGDTANAIAAALTTAINAADDLPVSAVNTGAPSAIVTLTALNSGALGREIDVRANYRGAKGGESYPAGVTITSGGDIATTPIRLGGGAAATPDTSSLITAMADTEYDFIAFPWALDLEMDRIETELGDDTGRWSPTRPIYGHAFTAADDTVGNLTTAGNARNSQHTTYVGIESCPTPPWEIAAAVVGQVAKARAADVAAVYHNLPLVGVLAPREADRFTFAESNTLMSDGVTVLTFGAGDTVYTDPLLTTYQTTPLGVPDTAMLDYTIMSDLTHIHRDWKSRMTTKYGRHRVADDGTQFGPGKAIVTPSMVEADAYSAFRAWEKDGIVEDFDQFADDLVVERNGTNPKRIDVNIFPDVTNALEVMAVKTSFKR